MLCVCVIVLWYSSRSMDCQIERLDMMELASGGNLNGSANQWRSVDEIEIESPNTVK